MSLHDYVAFLTYYRAIRVTLPKSDVTMAALASVAIPKIHQHSCMVNYTVSPPHTVLLYFSNNVQLR